jgi:hypothetical protein
MFCFCCSYILLCFNRKCSTQKIYIYIFLRYYQSVIFKSRLSNETIFRILFKNTFLACEPCQATTFEMHVNFFTFFLKKKKKKNCFFIFTFLIYLFFLLLRMTHATSLLALMLHITKSAKCFNKI